MATTTLTPMSTQTITPYLAVRDARRAIDWYVVVFDAAPARDPIVMDDGRIGHAELRIGASVLFLADEYPELGVLSPLTHEGSSVSLVVDVPDVDATFARALAAGATEHRPVTDQFYGRSGWLHDPFGHRWNVTTPPATSSEPSGLAGELGYFTLTTPDVDRAATFYGALFGWDADAAQPSSAGGDHRYRHVGNTSIPLGFHDDAEDPSPHHYYRVADLRAMTDKVRALGGEVLDVSEYTSGRGARCRDDQGVEFELWQPAPGY